ncbi:TPA: hypothetical protein DEP30_03995 [Candidatus Nomurabacteria bacterium]|nr:MAG: hypothetical protein UR97_C0008G0013 [Candidatus Nomurabacteria bacterium GW2011_GWE2_36_115]KKP93336.1 MAG: hypothetical protein US00_C0008G0013 [Candidatus Nomurabacteria bacterium GW2011_GWF2_36_126]KKP96398.1 MAG: hypothetical protein US04_C0002G0072 [Candidatus Nomurabacteria bacterium GW2011_GWD2_36_14]KKP99140.1 MAG: hypothetical protein US08_C0003G0034 [Candidatus Nomurabacteria bacterium GW2011_GWF2_36_19]KKQ05041.1 MAG: hypothetical protein US17_C0008G0013 [Candidatus Nomuraba
MQRIIKDKNIKWWLGCGSCIILFLIIAVFAWEKMSFLVKGVQIEASIERSSTSLAHIVGKARHATYITLNGREIFIDKDGSFSEPVALIPGFSVITIDTEDKFGNTKEKNFQLVYKESAGTVAMLK